MASLDGDIVIRVKLKGEPGTLALRRARRRIAVLLEVDPKNMALRELADDLRVVSEEISVEAKP